MNVAPEHDLTTGTATDTVAPPMLSTEQKEALDANPLVEIICNPAMLPVVKQMFDNGLAHPETNPINYAGVKIITSNYTRMGALGMRFANGEVKFVDVPYGNQPYRNRHARRAAAAQERRKKSNGAHPN